MTVPSEVSKSGPYNGNGSTTVFAYGFRVVSASHLRVVRVNSDLSETVLALNANYTVSGVGNIGGGNVTITPAPATGVRIVILRNVPYTQETDLENQGAYYAETVEAGFDLAAMRDQQLAELASRALKVPASYGPGSGDAMVADVIRIAQSADNIDTVAGSIANVNTVSGSIVDVSTVAANITDVTNFADVYLGPKSENPTVRNDGSPLMAGDLYFNTSSGRMMIYSGSGWSGAVDAGVLSIVPGTGISVDDSIPTTPVVAVTSVKSYGAIPGGTSEDLLAAFQDAIDDLPSQGGRIVVPPGDYTNLNPASLNVPLHKMVTWLSYGATLPEDMPGMRVTAGYQLQPYEGGTASSARPGDAFMRLIVDSHVPNTAQVSQQDSVLYIQGHIPPATGSLAQEFAAIRFNMHSEMDDPSVTPPTASNLDIKGIQGVVVGEAGNAKVRSIRTTSWGINGHTGLVTGAMVAACRGGTIPTESPWNGDGTTEWDPDQAGPYLTGDAALLAQVGPGIQAAMRMQGFINAARPAYGLLQELGNAALLPEQAAIFLHGGGNGDMIRGAVSHLDGTIIFAVTKAGRVRAKGFYSDAITVADDAVTSITPSTTTGFIDVFAQGTAANWYTGYYRAAASPVLTQIAAGTGGAGQTTSLSGTTGVDGNLTVASLSTGVIQVENRTGASRTITIVFRSS